MLGRFLAGLGRVPGRRHAFRSDTAPSSSVAGIRLHQQDASGGPSATGAAAPDDAVSLAEGQALFRGLCSGCHGGAGRGGKGPDLTDNRWIHGGTDEDIARVIQNGVPKTTMKKMGDALKPDQIRKLIAYIRSLARRSAESTWKPYIPGDPQAGRKLFFDLKARPSARSAIAWPAREAGSVRPSIASPAGALPNLSWNRFSSRPARSRPSTRPSSSPHKMAA